MIPMLIRLLIFSIVLSIAGCGKVKPYQKMHLNQESMQLSDPKLKIFETNILSYREGAEGGNGGKTGGGCGCN